jgi:hypothetical protein
MSMVRTSSTGVLSGQHTIPERSGTETSIHFG